jgi:hypothetical protein
MEKINKLLPGAHEKGLEIELKTCDQLKSAVNLVAVSENSPHIWPQFQGQVGLQ